MNLRNLSFTTSLMLALGTTLSLQAQVQPEPAPETQPSPYQEAPPAPETPPPPPDQTTLEEREAAAAPEIEQTPAVPDTSTPSDAAPKPAAAISADEKGFALKAAGDPSPFVLKLRLVIQLDARKYFDEYHTSDTMAPRRLRPYLDGTVLGLVDYRLLADFAGAQVAIMDAYADIHPWPFLRFRYGKFKTPIGLERLQSDPDLPFIERALTSALAPDRDVGLQIWGDVAGGVVSYAVGIFDGSADSSTLDTDNGKDKDFAGRLVIQPFSVKSLESFGQLGLGIAGTYGKRNGTARASGLVPFRSVGRPQFGPVSGSTATFFGYRAASATATAEEAMAGTVFAEGEHTRINPEFYYFIGGLGVLAEAVWSQQEVHLGGAQRKLTHRAWHATASYVFGGKNGLDGATPSKPFDPSEGNYGALEIGARYHSLELDEDAFELYADPAVSAEKASGFGVSLNWAWSRVFRLMVNFEQTKFEGGAADGGDRKTENLLLGRTQVVF